MEINELVALELSHEYYHQEQCDAHDDVRGKEMTLHVRRFLVFYEILYDEQQRHDKEPGFLLHERAQQSMCQVGEHFLQCIDAIAQGVGTEEHQCQHHKEEGDDAVQPQPPLLFLELVLLLKLTLTLVLQDAGHEEEAEDAEAHNIRPIGAVPEARQEKGEEDAETPPVKVDAASDHRVVDVVHKPRGEGDVVALPEFLNRRGEEVRPDEVVHQLESHHLGGTDGDVGIPREITIQLEAEQDGSHEYLTAGLPVYVIVYKVDIVSQVVGNDKFEEKAPQHQLYPPDGPLAVETVLLVKLAQQVGGALDGARHQLREERDEERIDEEVLFRLGRPAVHVDGVTQRLEDVEGDAHGQEDVELRNGHPQAEGAEKARHALCRPVEILEKKQYRKVDDERGHQERLLPLSIFLDAQGCQVGHRGAGQQQQDIDRLPAHVEIVAGCQQEQVPPLV